jgi:hypothetical protein
MAWHIIAALLASSLSTAQAPPAAPIEHLSAKAIEITSPARIGVRAVDIVINRWSTGAEHDALKRALLENSPAAFLDRLSTIAPIGAIVMAGGGEFTIRYAWGAVERDGSRRIFVAVDQPITLEHAVRRPAGPPLTFLEIRLDRSGCGSGKLSEADRISVDETQDVIELTGYEGRPVHLLDVRSLLDDD